MGEPSFIIFPGLGANKDLDKYHQTIGSKRQWIEWEDPSGVNSVQEYAQRLEHQIRRTDDIFYIGISFGGLVCLEMSRILKPRGIFHLGSLQSAKEISTVIRLFSNFVPSLPSVLFNLSLFPKKLLYYYFGISHGRHRAEFEEMLQGYAPQFVRRLVVLALRYSSLEKYDIPIIRIHGSRDKIVSNPRGKIDFLVNGGHIISMSNSSEVNEYIRECAARM